MDAHNKSTELGLETEGAYLSEKEIHELADGEDEVDYPMPGEKRTNKEEEQHTHSMPENIEYIDESGKRII